MKKIMKIAASVLLILSLSLSFVSCSIYLVDFNKLLDRGYDNLKVEVKTEQEMGTLVNIYDISEKNNEVSVKYSCQKFATLDMTSGGTDRIQTLSGEVLYSDGEEVSQSGDKVLFDLPKSANPDLNLSTSNMRNIKETAAGKMEADIVNPSLLFGRSLNATDAKIAITFTDTAITSIVITYTKASARVTVTLTFD